MRQEVVNLTEKIETNQKELGMLDGKINNVRKDAKKFKEHIEQKLENTSREINEKLGNSIQYINEDITNSIGGVRERMESRIRELEDNIASMPVGTSTPANFCNPPAGLRFGGRSVRDLGRLLRL